MRLGRRIDFLSPISVVAGLGPRRVEALNRAGIVTVGDLLNYFPRRYIDRSIITPIGELEKHVGAIRTIVGEVTYRRIERRGQVRLRIGVADASGRLEAVWFAAVPHMKKELRLGQRVALTGKASYFNGIQMAHPLVETLRDGADRPDIPYLPRYCLSAAMRSTGIGHKLLLRTVVWCLDNVKQYPSLLPQSIEAKRHFPTLQDCLRQMHLPYDPAALERFRARLRYEELYRLALALRWSRRALSLPGRPMNAGTLFSVFVKNLPFTLTDDQRHAIDMLHADACSSRRMHRLLQGDVGSGKTVVAFAACLPALNENLQVAWMTPTELLAEQAWELIGRWLAPMHIEARLLTASIGPDERASIVRDLASGQLRFVVGTHALLQPAVKFARLGMIVIDEQHRFGAQQRLCLIEKDPAADVLLMSATPIPQTLAKTLYGDMDLVVLRHGPVGRVPVTTRLVPAAKRHDMERFIVSKIVEKNSQVLYIAPRIEPQDDDEQPMADVTSAFRALTSSAFSHIPAGLLHGGMDAEERRKVMRSFTEGKIKLLVSTTIVEVGIDVPAATIMVIENAERFGLAQLHQLRGRVGRNSGESFCFLFSDAAPGSAAEKRLKFFCKEHDGFAIAEADLHMRGPGDIVGARQWGWDSAPWCGDVLNDAEQLCDIFRELDRLFPHGVPPLATSFPPEIKSKKEGPGHRLPNTKGQINKRKI